MYSQWLSMSVLLVMMQSIAVKKQSDTFSHSWSRESSQENYFETQRTWKAKINVRLRELQSQAHGYIQYFLNFFRLWRLGVLPYAHPELDHRGTFFGSSSSWTSRTKNGKNTFVCKQDGFDARTCLGCDESFSVWYTLRTHTSRRTGTNLHTTAC